MPITIENMSSLDPEQIAEVRKACSGLAEEMTSDGYSVGDEGHKKTCTKASNQLVDMNEAPIENIGSFRPAPTKSDDIKNPSDAMALK